MRRSSIAAVLVWILAIAPLGAAQPNDGWIDLFNGKDMSGWKLADEKGKNGWSVEDGVTINRTPSTNIVSEKRFRDFDLHCEFQVPTGSNAGIYILQRYEIQIFDDYNRPIHSHMCGSLYGEITPLANGCRPPARNFPKIASDEWQTFDVTFRAARYNDAGEKTDNVRVTVIHNGVRLHDNVELKTPTGAARRFDEEAPMPILLQGDHGPVTFRAFRIRGEAFDPPDPKSPGPKILDLDIQPKQLPEYQAAGVALSWKTPSNAYAPRYLVYRAETPDFPLERANLRATVEKRSFEECCFETNGRFYYRIVAAGLGGANGPMSEPINTVAQATQVRTPVLSDASWARTEGQSVPRRNRTSGGKPLTMQGNKYDKGIGMVSPAAIRFYVSEMVGPNTDYRFRATVGLDDSIAASRRAGAAARFLVELDDKVIFDSGAVKWSDGVKDVDVALPGGARKLVLRVERKGEARWDAANWANVRLERGGK